MLKSLQFSRLYSTKINRRLINQKIKDLPYKQSHYIPDKFKKLLEEEVVESILGKSIHEYKPKLKRPRKSIADDHLSSIPEKYGIKFEKKTKFDRNIRFNAEILRNLLDLIKNLPYTESWTISHITSKKRRNVNVYWRWIDGIESEIEKDEVEDMLNDGMEFWIKELNKRMDLRTSLNLTFLHESEMKRENDFEQEFEQDLLKEFGQKDWNDQDGKL